MQVIAAALEVEDQTTLPDLIARTADTLRTLAGQLEEGTLLDPVEWVIPMADIGTERMEEHCDAIAARLGKKHLAVYAICFDDDVPLERVYQVVDGNKAANKTLPVQDRRAFARVNKRKGCLGSRCLYVGKSEKAAERLRQHLIEANPATFAIHLKYWPNDIPGNLIVKVIGVAGVQSILLPFIEDQMASEMPPILGKRGSV
ncbi:hypothetical protein [Sphingobium limneticum]|uniref:Uncharacterized protein n=1 Tax=Sphingobium limneticum TaxID=1007511 RepID=A0A5J5I5K7_9SPHN|nr:hypothetical protein [Sphingobium limneticum]KAA9018267.1 hypothetical protein F4U96_09150 [Sphingobium limneticum]KAA9030903.1 hypothetical protein F4U95_09100 [Sphingobium limneticum]